jgi:hypothetical protein
MAGASPGRGSRRCDEIAARFVIRAAGLAPSVHNTQPWYFTSDQGVIRLYADPGRGLPEADPAGREMVISCGAALANLSLAMRHLGFTSDVRLLPDLSRSGLLAEIRWGRHAPPTLYENLLYQSMRYRHTRDDRRPGWLIAGQALQRLLLFAAARDVNAAFHTQPLELAATRQRIRAEFTGGLYPQMLLRLGRSDQAAASPRRPVADTLREETARRAGVKD